MATPLRRPFQKGTNMRAASTVTRLARLAATATVATLGLAIGGATVAAPAASAATTAAATSASNQVGWIRLAHLSPNTPAVDVYLYSFGNSSAQLRLNHVAYGDVSPFEQVAAGEYTVAMRPAGAPSSSKPVLSTTVDVLAGHAYTVAGLGPESGLRLEVIPDALKTPPGKALVRVIQASMQQDKVTVTAGGTTLASNLKFASYTSYRTVSPDTWTVKASGATESATESITLTAGSIHTVVVLDEPGKLAIDDLLDAEGSKVEPRGPAQTGFGGTAARPGAALLPWAAAGAAGLLSAITGIVLVSRRRRPALHAR
jgi:Domain of unknown function (DUF4397)